MARKDTFLFIFLLNLASCSVLDGFHSKLKEINRETSSQEFISKDKYERLLVKYESLKIEKNKTAPLLASEKLPSTLDEEILFFKKTLEEPLDHEEKVRRFNVIINSENLHLRTRVMYELAKTYEVSEECDQSLPLIDDLINNHAFSGIVLPALVLGISCSEKLKIPTKVANYTGLLAIFAQ
jgi:hypothetical protein